jgi:hypothetical protein
MVRIAGHPRIELMRIAKPKPDILPEGLGLAARTVGYELGVYFRIGRRARIVIQSRKGAPRHPLILF